MRAILAYIAGPYTKPDPVKNTHMAVRFASALYVISRGAVVPVVPHLSMLWHAITPMSYEDWLAIDLAVVERCDALIRLAGESSGADGEVEFAQERGLPIIYVSEFGTFADRAGEAWFELRECEVGR